MSAARRSVGCTAERGRAAASAPLPRRCDQPGQLAEVPLRLRAQVRSGDWRVAPLPADLLDRRVEITGPTDRKMVINALDVAVQERHPITPPGPHSRAVHIPPLPL